MIFEYQAVDYKGIATFGEIEAVNEKQAVRELRSKNLSVTELTQVERAIVGKIKKRASEEDVISSLHEMVTLLEAGVSVGDTIESQCLANYPLDLAKNYELIASELQKGADFTQALRASGMSLPNYMYQLSKAGELVGDLSGSLRSGLNQLEYERRLSSDFKAALTYPIILLLSGLLAVILVFTVVVPKFVPMLERVDDLPMISEMVFTMGVFFNENILLVGLISALLAFGLIWGLRHRAARDMIYDFFSRTPIIGAWLTQNDVARWCAILGVMLASKVEILESIELANLSVHSTRRRNGLKRVIGHIKAGETLSDSLEKERVLTAVGYNLIRSGERSGRVAPMVASLAKLYDEASRKKMQKVLGLMEPLSIIIIGVVIGTIILAIMLGITSANTVGI